MVTPPGDEQNSSTTRPGLNEPRDATPLQRIVPGRNPPFAGHLFAFASPTQPALITVGGPEVDGAQTKQHVAGGAEVTHFVRQGVGESRFPMDRSVHLMEREVGEDGMPTRLPSPYPLNPTPANQRLPLPYEPQGYMHILPREDQSWRQGLVGAESERVDETQQLPGEGEQRIAEQAHGPPAGDYVSDEDFEKLVGDFRGGDGKFLAMTAYGAVPLPEQMLHSIPEKFVTRPLIQEREVFVLKQDHCTRLTERDYTQFEHRFVDVPKCLVVDKIKAVDDVKIIEVPHFKYKPVVEDKIVEIPHGIKYVEVPIEVPCRMPPRIVPVPKPHFVERIVETTKPVVQEKIIEIPEVVRKKVPKIVTKDIPYVVPRYVEKIVEVPYEPGQQLPDPQGAQMMSIPKPPPLPARPPQGTYGLQLPTVNLQQRVGEPVPDVRGVPSGHVEGDTLVVSPTEQKHGEATKPQTFYVAQGIKHIKLPYEARIDISVIEEEAVPQGVPVAQKGVRYMAPGSRAMAYGSTGALQDNEAQDDDAIYAGPMDPIVEHAAPGMRAIEFRTRPGSEPDILTQRGVITYSHFQRCLQDNDPQQLAPHLSGGQRSGLLPPPVGAATMRFPLQG